MKVEYNEINIFAEFQLHNLIFAKNELLFDNIRAAVVLDLFWNLLEFNPDGPTEEEEEETSPFASRRRRGSQGSTYSGSPLRANSDVQMIQYMGDGVTTESTMEQQFAAMLSKKFNLFK